VVLKTTMTWNRGRIDVGTRKGAHVLLESGAAIG
jgi:hypothetical protein